MKRAYIIIPVSILLLLTGCKYFKKEKVVQNDVDSLLNISIPDTIPDTLPVIVKDVYQLSEIDDKYLIIVGSFQNIEYAKRHAKKYSELGLDTKVISKPDGFYMVSARSFESKDIALKDIKDFRRRIAKKSWVFENTRITQGAPV